MQCFVNSAENAHFMLWPAQQEIPHLHGFHYRGFWLFWKINFPPMRALEFITGHVIYNLAYTYKFQLKITLVH